MALIRHDSPVRLFAAAFCVLGGLGSLASAFLGELRFGLATALPCFVLAFVFFERDWWMILRGMSPEERTAELERRGDITHETVRARRALHLFDRRTSCDVYLIDCEDGRLLCLYGQYFHDWEPIEEEDGSVQKRGFPTQEFVITRRSPDACVYHLQPGKKVIHPEFVGGDIALLHASGLNLWSSDGSYLPVAYDEVRQIMRGTRA